MPCCCAWTRRSASAGSELFAALKGGAFGRLLTTVYELSGMQLALLVAYLGVSGRTAELDRFLLAFFLATLTAFAFWAVFPSFGAATYLVSTGAITDIPGATVGRSFALVLLALKSGALNEMFLQDLKGLVAFPSMHTVMALLTVYAVRDVPLLFWPVLVWNGLMLVAIPVDGGHHVVDVAGGAVLTVAAIAAARRISRWVERGGTYPIPAAAAIRAMLDGADGSGAARVPDPVAAGLGNHLRIREMLAPAAGRAARAAAPPSAARRRARARRRVGHQRSSSARSSAMPWCSGGLDRMAA